MDILCIDLFFKQTNVGYIFELMQCLEISVKNLPVSLTAVLCGRSHSHLFAISKVYVRWVWPVLEPAFWASAVALHLCQDLRVAQSFHVFPRLAFYHQTAVRNGNSKGPSGGHRETVIPALCSVSRDREAYQCHEGTGDLGRAADVRTGAFMVLCLTPLIWECRIYEFVYYQLIYLPHSFSPFNAHVVLIN